MNNTKELNMNEMEKVNGGFEWLKPTNIPKREDRKTKTEM